MDGVSVSPLVVTVDCVCPMTGPSPGLDVLACTAKVVEDVCCHDSIVIEPSSSALNLEVTDDDRRKIHALSWLYFEEKQCVKAVIQSNRLMREFLSEKGLVWCSALWEEGGKFSIEWVLPRMHVSAAIVCVAHVRLTPLCRLL